MAVYQDQLTEYTHDPGFQDGEGKPIFWKRTRFELITSGKFWFSRTPDVRSSDWGVPYPMGAVWVQLKDRQTGAYLVHLNTHFEDGAEGEQSRVESSKLIVTRLAHLTHETPVIVTGDFNCNPWSAAYNIFAAGGFTDTYRAAGQADSVASSTFHGYRGQQYFSLEWGGELFWRVDWILTTCCTRPRCALDSRRFGHFGAPHSVGEVWAVHRAAGERDRWAAERITGEA